MIPTGDTPLLQQYWKLKEQAASALLFFRMGDFYELFGEDAIKASKILNITLTSRDKKSPDPLPMAGVPFHSAEPYIQKLVDAGYKVAIAEQVQDAEEAKNAKTIVQREIVRIYTPAVYFQREGSQASYLGYVVQHSPSNIFLLTLLDASTGDIWIDSLQDKEALFSRFSQLPIRHVLVEENLLELLTTLSSPQCLVEKISTFYSAPEQLQSLLLAQFKNLNLLIPPDLESPLASADLKALVERSLGILIRFILKAQKLDRLTHLKLPRSLQQKSTLTLGPSTAEHLALVPSLQRNGFSEPTLLEEIDSTQSSMGARCLRSWLLQPLRDPTKITARQETVRELCENPSLAENIKTLFKEIYDLERITGRISTQLASPKDTVAFAHTWKHALRISELLKTFQSPLLRETFLQLQKGLQETRLCAEKILQFQKQPAPHHLREGGIFEKGLSPALDELLDLSQNGEQWLLELERRERETTGIHSLKVRYNRVFGYFIEITKSNLSGAPAHYIRKQTMANGDRFITEELKNFEEKILSSHFRQVSLEKKLFEDLLKECELWVPSFQHISEALAKIDGWVCFATLATRPGWVFPKIGNDLNFEIEGGRHPVVDRHLGGNFVPNSIQLNPQKNVLIVTGPNMGGKSTYLRQNALMVILGQAGAPIPAIRAEWGVFSSIFTRIGANDAISRGQSTFMVEMSELAQALRHGNERSLLVLDEVGRGTSTFDGMSVAWATLEWIAKSLKCRTIFATHYHELTQLEKNCPGIHNAHCAVAEEENETGEITLRFLFEIRTGPSNDSFGIQVAEMAGLPSPIIERSWKILNILEKSNGEQQRVRPSLTKKSAGDLGKSSQLKLF